MPPMTGQNPLLVKLNHNTTSWTTSAINSAVWVCATPSNHGQPLQENHRAVTAFQLEFNYRVWSSVTAHPNKFNGAQTTHKTGPRGGKIKSTVYRDWVEANGGKWVGFQWKLLE